MSWRQEFPWDLPAITKKKNVHGNEGSMKRSQGIPEEGGSRSILGRNRKKTDSVHGIPWPAGFAYQLVYLQDSTQYKSRGRVDSRFAS